MYLQQMLCTTKSVLSSYLIKFQRDVEEIMHNENENLHGTEFDNVFQNMVKGLDLKHHAYSMSDCRDVQWYVRQGRNPW